MDRKNIHFPKTLFAKLKSLSKKTGVPIAELVRRAVAEFLAKHGD